MRQSYWLIYSYELLEVANKMVSSLFSNEIGIFADTLVLFYYDMFLIKQLDYSLSISIYER